MITHYDVSSNMLKLIGLLDTCLQLNYQHPNDSNIKFAIDSIYHTLNQANEDILECINVINLCVENPSNKN